MRLVRPRLRRRSLAEPGLLSRRPELLLFALVAAVYVTGPNITHFDSYLAVPTAVSIVHAGDLDIDEFRAPHVRSHYGNREHGGHRYDHYPWPVALFFVPAVVAADVVHQVGVGPGATGLVQADQMGWLQMITASMVTALAAVVVYRIALDRLSGPLDKRRPLAWVIALAFAFGTSAWSTSSRAMWQHGPSMVMLGLALLAALRLTTSARPGRTGALLGASLAAAYVIRPTNAVPAVVLSVWVLACHRRHAVALLAGATAVALPWLAVNVASYGRLLPPYNSVGRLRLHGDYFEALAANVVSPARGIVVFSPIVLLAVAGVIVPLVRKQLGGLDVAVATSVVLDLLVVSAPSEGWSAGHSFGPRLLADVLPLLAYLSVPAVDALWHAFRARPRRWPVKAATAITAAALVLSVLVNAQGAYFRAVNCWNFQPTDVDRHPERVWSLRDPQFLSGYRAVGEDGIKEAMFGDCRPST